MSEHGIGVRNVLDETDQGGFVEVMFATSRAEATVCLRLLEQSAIPARIETDSQGVGLSGIAVLVPEARLVEASELLSASADADPVDDDGFEEDDDSDDVSELDDDDDDLEAQVFGDDEDDLDDDYEDDDED